ncbi:iron complex transport system permease protein [Tamaricihabitans halophyticus]|uniref:Iron complex transport system permease protein n=1 Tax=Tamaricihabitans halophyticus TaxID=1262583 RepID=A0A4R2RC59_9PSEU|nr:iron chelate uptake ABC transporter family permease subunit [Tamaricihabitans halophyticus]TCP57311.1 iron complex transport system permease protein [Tamaricihabitans halophyticus]
MVETAVREPTRVRSNSVVVLGALISLCVVALMSIVVGSNQLPLDAVWHALFHYDGSYTDAVVRDARLPRTILGICVGLALGLAGALLQGATRNPVADPGLLGVNYGAAVAIVFAGVLFGVQAPTALIWFSFCGALGGTVLVYLLGGSASPVRLILAGVAVQATFVGLNQAMQVIDTNSLDKMRYWLVGSLANRDVPALAPLLPFLIIGVVLAITAARGLNAIALGDDTARGLGATPGATRLRALLAVGLLCGTATAAAGPIAFVGLMIPHLVRMLVGQDHRWVLPLSALLGPVLVLGCDVLGRVLGSPGELQVGIMTEILGGLVFLFLVRRLWGVRR